MNASANTIVSLEGRRAPRDFCCNKCAKSPGHYRRFLPSRGRKRSYSARKSDQNRRDEERYHMPCTDARALDRECLITIHDVEASAEMIWLGHQSGFAAQPQFALDC